MTFVVEAEQRFRTRALLRPLTLAIHDLHAAPAATRTHMALGRTVAPSDIKRVRTDGSALESGQDLESLIKQRANKNSKYEKYKEGLSAFFGGGQELPEHLREMLQDAPGAEEAGVMPVDKEAPKAEKKKRTRRRKKGGITPARAEGRERKRRIVAQEDPAVAALNNIKKANSPREVEAAVNAYLELGHDLPEDVELLSKVLGHSSDDVLTKALDALTAMDLNDETKGGALLKTRLKNVALLTASSDVRGLCADVEEQLKQPAPQDEEGED